MDKKYFELKEKLKIDCSKCSGLCCVELFYMKTDGFPCDKEAGIPCKYLMSDFKCRIHNQLYQKKLHGCIAYDCLGAGQAVTQRHALNDNWKQSKAKTDKIFNEFQIIFELHEIEWYLLDAYSLNLDKKLTTDIEFLIDENERIANLPFDELMCFDIDTYRNKANELLKLIIRKISGDSHEHANKNYFGHNFHGANLNNKDLSMALLIAANFEGCSVKNTIFLGADLRDADFRNVDLSSALFLTQMQINTAKGNEDTILPPDLVRPDSWMIK